MTVNNSLTPVNTAQVCNQGSVTADGGLNILTNDPDTGAPNDPTCTAMQPGKITIIKDAQPNDAQDFDFSGNSPINSFSLDDDAEGTLPNQQTFTVPAGSYSVQESSVSNWDLTALACQTADVTDTTSTDLGSRLATIDVDYGETITCTFTNVKRGKITVIKDAQPDSDDNFTISIGGAGAGISSSTMQIPMTATLLIPAKVCSIHPAHTLSPR